MTTENLTELKQGDAIRDYVFPLVRVEEDGPGIFRATRFLGTGFFFGRRGFALTASHVIKDHIEALVAALLWVQDRWFPVLVKRAERHGVHDIAILEMSQQEPGFKWHGIVSISAQWVGSSYRYSLWGYPEDAAYELEQQGTVQLRPDLVFSEGHIRRRMTAIPVPRVSGTEFFELSEVAGGGCSGSPVLGAIGTGQHWEVIGVYTGERGNDRATSVGYATRIEAVRDWVPELLGHSLLSEAPSS